LTHALRPANSRALAGEETPNRRAPVSGGSNKNPRLILCKLTNFTSRAIVQARPEDLGWNVVLEMILASRPKFVRIAYDILRNKEDAEDAVQDASLSAYLHLSTFEGRSAFGTWFTRIVLNAALVIRRKRKRSRIEFFPESCTTDQIHWMEQVPAAQPDPEMSWAEAETFELIDDLLLKMNPLLRQAFTMTYYEEMSNEEACALLGVKRTTFKSRLSRARQQLMNQAGRFLVAPIRGGDAFALFGRQERRSELRQEGI
jgi:RNA polymerase sigma-70 factor, ECF subfamily